MKILLLEDNSDYAETLNDFFSEEDHYFKWVETIEGVKQALDKEKWDIILSDIHLEFLPISFLRLYHKSLKNNETPLIFLTAEKETDLTSELIEMGNFPVISKYDVNKNILKVVQNYSLLYSKIKEQEKIDTQVSFKKYIAGYINEKKYETNGLSKTLEEWINQETRVFTRLSKKFNIDESYDLIPATNISCIYLQLDAETFHVTMASHSAQKLFHTSAITGLKVDFVLNDILFVDKLIFILNKIKSDKTEEVTVVNISGINEWKKYDFSVSVQLVLNEMLNVNYFDIEITKVNNHAHVGELLSTKETNQLLLEEVHHRVNNNLSLINSLLNLRMINAEPKLADAYTNVLRQLLPVSTVYKVLYSSDSVSDIILKEYLIRFFEAYSNSNGLVVNNKNITTDDSAVKLNINQMIPLGLFLNEILELFDENVDDVTINVEHDFDLINIRVRGGNIGETIKNITENDGLVMNSLLNNLSAMISNISNDEVLVRFKREYGKGSASNL